LRQARAHPEKYPWVTQLLARKPAKVIAVAIANKTARIAWAVLIKKEIYRVQTTAVCLKSEAWHTAEVFRVASDHDRNQGVS
jgi:hypothetical protein